MKARTVGAVVSATGLAYFGLDIFLDFIQALIWLALLTGTVAVGVAISLLVHPLKRQSAEEKELEAKVARDAERQRYAWMSHLTAADERWLAERHHFVVPKPVARIRAGLPWDKPIPADSPQISLPAIRNRKELVKRADQARKMFVEGDFLEAPMAMNPSFTSETIDTMPREPRPAPKAPVEEPKVALVGEVMDYSIPRSAVMDYSIPRSQCAHLSVVRKLKSNPHVKSARCDDCGTSFKRSL